MKFVFTLILFNCLFLIANGQNTADKSNNSQKEAQELWEKAIEAKGGREKLHTIHNIVISSNSEVQSSLFKTYRMAEESLYVFPDKVWTWLDNRPSIFGLRMMMHDYKTQMKYSQVLGSSENVNVLVPFESSEQKKEGSELNGLIFSLMETYWLIPVPESVTHGKINSRRVDTIQTSIQGDRFDFALDQITHLPIQITHFYYEPVSKLNLKNSLNLSDYQQISGIMMATTIRPEGESGKYKDSFQFNVKYNEEIFSEPPSFEAGPEAWRLKSEK